MRENAMDFGHERMGLFGNLFRIEPSPALNPFLPEMNQPNLQEPNRDSDSDDSLLPNIFNPNPDNFDDFFR